MLSPDQFMDIALLHKEGRSLREIAKLTGHSRNTIRRVIREKVPRAFCTPSRPSKLDPFKDYLRERFLDHGLSAVRLFAEVRAMGFTGSEIIVRRFVHTLRESSCKKLTVRFETPPGEQAQADWAEVGRFTLPGGDVIRLYAFVMVLSFSRALYIEFTRSMRVETLICCHQTLLLTSADGRARSFTTTCARWSSAPIASIRASATLPIITALRCAGTDLTGRAPRARSNAWSIT
jgi:transposase